MSVCLSVPLTLCPSVRPSVTIWYCIKTNKAIASLFFIDGEPKTLVFADIRLIQKFERGHPERLETGVGRATFNLHGHSLKLFLPRFSTTVRKTFFSTRVASDWNALPSAGLTHKRTKRVLMAPSCKGAPSKAGQKLIK